MLVTAGDVDIVECVCSPILEEHMDNPGQPSISVGATGDVVKRLQRAPWRTPDHSINIDGVFRPQVEAAVRLFQEGLLTVDGIVGPETWAALPDGGPMSTPQIGSTGAIVSSLQAVLTNGTSDWNTAPHRIDGSFGPDTRAAVIAFRAWGGVPQSGIVEEQTWAVPLHAANATLETMVGLEYMLGRRNFRGEIP
jgi:peptidoglycan hydrolase-like protein with peptidoglycan-binding domain